MSLRAEGVAGELRCDDAQSGVRTHRGEEVRCAQGVGPLRLRAHTQGLKVGCAQGGRASYAPLERVLEVGHVVHAHVLHQRVLANRPRDRHLLHRLRTQIKTVWSGVCELKHYRTRNICESVRIIRCFICTVDAGY